MGDSFQNEVPTARVNIKLDLHTGGVQKKVELPLKLLTVGDFSNGREQRPLSEREKIDINKNNFNDVLAKFSPVVNLSVKNTLADDDRKDDINLAFKNIRDFEPEQVARNIPQLRVLLAMRNLLRDLKSNLLDTVFILLFSIPGIVYGWRQYGRLKSAHSAHEVPLPPESFSGPVVLVCGDNAPLFAGRGDSCESSQGWYLSVQSPEHYIALVRQIAVQRPGFLMRVSVMLALIPERHNDEDALKHMLLSWRRVVTQSRRWLSGIPPFWLCCWLNSPQCNEAVRWFIRTPQDAEVQSANDAGAGNAGAFALFHRCGTS